MEQQQFEEDFRPADELDDVLKRIKRIRVKKTLTIVGTIMGAFTLGFVLGRI